MALAFENLSQEELRVYRDEQRRLVASLPRNNVTAEFLAASAAQALDSLIALQDSFMVLAIDATCMATVAGASHRTALRAVLTAMEHQYGRLLAAAKFSMAAVNHTAEVASPIPGFSPAALKAMQAFNPGREATPRTRQAAPARNVAAAASMPSTASPAVCMSFAHTGFAHGRALPTDWRRPVFFWLLSGPWRPLVR